MPLDCGGLAKGNTPKAANAALMGAACAAMIVLIVHKTRFFQVVAEPTMEKHRQMKLKSHPTCGSDVAKPVAASFRNLSQETMSDLTLPIHMLCRVGSSHSPNKIITRTV